MINATIPSIITNTGINRCRTAVTTITISVVVTITSITMIAINTIMIIITSTRLLLLLALTFFTNLSMGTNPIMITNIISVTAANVYVNSSDRSSTTTTIFVVIASINIKFSTNYCGSYQYLD